MTHRQESRYLEPAYRIEARCHLLVDRLIVTEPFVWARVGRLLIETDRVEAATSGISAPTSATRGCAHDNSFCQMTVYCEATNPLVVKSLPQLGNNRTGTTNRDSATL